MPIFDYVCPECKTIREILCLSNNPRQTVTCSKCDVEMNKMLGAPGLLVTNFHDKPSPKQRSG